MAQVAPDTPDYQRGLVSAQKLLIDGHTGSGAVETGVPPNCETLIVVLKGAAAGTSVQVIGAITGIGYPGVVGKSSTIAAGSLTWFFDVSSATEAEYVVNVECPLTAEWMAYADSGVHLIGDISRYTNGLGAQYVVPIVPATDSGDHPPVELQYGFATVGGGGTVIAAPGAGKRLRVFAAQIGNFTASVDASLFDSNGVIFCTAHGVNPSGWFTYPLTGIALPTNSAIFLGNGGGTCTAVVIYTTETV